MHVCVRLCLHLRLARLMADSRRSDSPVGSMLKVDVEHEVALDQSCIMKGEAAVMPPLHPVSLIQIGKFLISCHMVSAGVSKPNL